ncbi:MAG: thioredoxin family protein [Elusimicrobiota bacterium]|jgi:small redox-active disulfide protein 2
MKIEVFGPGCRRCAQVEEVIRTVAAELRPDAEIVKIKDIQEMASRGVLMTPTVMIDGKKVCEGKVPTADMVKEWLK